MADEPVIAVEQRNQKDEKKAAEGEVTAATEQPQALKLHYDESAHATYSNLCRVTGTPEEVIMDFALNPNAFGPAVDEPMKIDHRIVMGYEAAKRTALVLLETVRRHEERFGEIELDPRRRLKGFKLV
ncbi:MAG: DUF3467 domain-containing protein [Verrucomicrobiia bacterium]